jgi:hypothetical protein
LFRGSSPENDRDPGIKTALLLPVYHRCPAAPALAPTGAYVYQAKKSRPKSD